MVLEPVEVPPVVFEPEEDPMLVFAPELPEPEEEEVPPVVDEPPEVELPDPVEEEVPAEPDVVVLSVVSSGMASMVLPRDWGSATYWTRSTLDLGAPSLCAVAVTW